MSNESNSGHGDDFCRWKVSINCERLIVVVCLMQALIYHDPQQCFWNKLRIVSNDSKPVEPDRLFECLPNSLRPSSSGSPRKHGDDNSKSPTEHQGKSLENAVYTLPTLIPPRVIPLLHDLAQQMAQAGHQQQLFRIYRWFFPFHIAAVIIAHVLHS